jgi:hypothetical protein
VLVIKLSILHMLGKGCTTELQSQPFATSYYYFMFGGSLVNCLQKMLRCVSFPNFHGVNILTLVDFKLVSVQQEDYKAPEYLTLSSNCTFYTSLFLPGGDGVGTDLLGVYYAEVELILH